MVSVPEDDLGLHLPLQFVDVDGLYGGSRAHGHEDGRLDGPVSSFDAARTGGGLGVGML